MIEEICPDYLSFEDNKQALNVVNLIKKKRDGTIKGRMSAYSSKQR